MSIETLFDEPPPSLQRSFTQSTPINNYNGNPNNISPLFTTSAIHPVKTLKKTTSDSAVTQKSRWGVVQKSLVPLRAFNIASRVNLKDLSSSPGDELDDTMGPVR